ncbi:MULTISPECIES: hypothetical protein [Exiguobacterium]|uniref:Uncharacterized protein n=1 Tax=Exiguobacterium aurantiacum TaxID=33987 RepID=A0A377FQW2_9BACL|nr:MULTISPECIES: hypothetical protein [Exiguobacterium]STO07230.1 Uncharacterised protein [Exiguobacterium aurantiacum]
MRFIVTCYLREGKTVTFYAYGSSQFDVERTFKETLLAASPLNDFVELSEGWNIPVGSILAYRVDEVKPALLKQTDFG